MKSIQSRLATGLLISLVAVFLLLWYIVSSNIQQLAENYIASRLEHDIETLITATTFENDIAIIDEARIDTIYQRPFSGHYYSIQHKNNIIRSRSLWDQSLLVNEAITADYVKTYQTGPENQSLLVMSGQFNKQKQIITISVAEDLTPVAQDINRFKTAFAVAALLMLLVLILTQIFILRQELKPLRKIRRELHDLEQGLITKLSSDVPYEIKPVTDEINSLSQALHKRLKRSRDALSDLSHTIKKPLTVLQQFFDKNRASLDQASLEMLNKQITDIQQITDRILKRARVAGRSQFNRLFQLNDDLTVLIQTINSMYPDKNIEVSLNMTDSIEIHLDREDMLELLGNLLDNAWKWAKNRVNISINQTDKLMICIEDDGPGIEQESLHQLASRGQRLDESVKGYGFGLAIAADIIRDYQGSLSFDRSETLGGFKAVIELPIKI